MSAASIPPTSYPSLPSRPTSFTPKRSLSLRPPPASSPDAVPEPTDPIKLALAKAAAYKKSAISAPKPSENQGSTDDGGSVGKEVPDSVKLAMERAGKYKKDKGSTDDGGSVGKEVPDSVKLAIKRAGKYKKDKVSTDDGGSVGKEVADLVKLAMERAGKYKKDKGVANVSGQDTVYSGQEKKASNSGAGVVDNKMGKKEKLTVSSTDFLGFGFSEKKTYRGTPPGLIPSVEPLYQDDLPDVEIIVGDTSKFDVKSSSENLLKNNPSEISSDKDNDDVDLYKPKVSTWGVFPRPSNISKTFGGGRVIQPGEVQETAEDKAAKEKRTKELVTAYKKRMGLTIDAKTKAECERALKEGDKLMDRGKLREALPFYEKVMKDVVFQSELHGLAALQWSVCQDSLTRLNEAKIMYEKLQSHPNVQVSKKARQFVFSFKAMEMMKVKSSSYSRTTGYEDYFQAFVRNKDKYTPQEEEQDEGALGQALPYVMFLISPILFVFLVAVRKYFHY